MEILKVENLYKIYGKGNNQVQALNDISVSYTHLRIDFMKADMMS